MPFPDPKYLLTSDEQVLEFIDTQLPRRLKKFLRSGVTTVLSAGGYWPFEIEIRNRIRAGELLGPRMLVTSPIFTAPGGHPGSAICNGHPWCVKTLSWEAGDEQTARRGVRRFVEGGVDGIKVVYDAFDRTALGGPDLGFPRLDKNVLVAIVAEAHARGLPVIAHAKTLPESADVVKAGVDALVHTALMEKPEFTTPEGEYFPGLVHGHGLSVTTTVRSFREQLDSAHPERRERLQQNVDLIGPSLRAYEDAGVTLMFGTDFDGAGLDPDPRDAILSEARTLVAAGFSELDVIAMATGNASRHPMVPAALGSIQAGKLADILILEDDPLVDISAIARPLIVIQAGQIVIDRRLAR